MNIDEIALSEFSARDLSILEHRIYIETRGRRHDYCVRQATAATITDAAVDDIVNSERRTFHLSLADFAKVELAMEKEVQRVCELGGVRMYPLVSATEVDDEFILLFDSSQYITASIGKTEAT